MGLAVWWDLWEGGRADVSTGLSVTMSPCLKAGQAVGSEVAGSDQVQPGDDGGVHPERTQ